MSAVRVPARLIAVAAAALVSIAGYEQYRGDAYLPTKDDVPTIGWGETKGVKLGDKTEPTRALVQLLVSVNEHAEHVRRCVKVPLFQHEFDAYVSLAYNIGAAAFCGSTLVRLLNQGQYGEACKQILRWNKQAGKTLRGLTIRRQGEYKQCMGEA